MNNVIIKSVSNVTSEGLTIHLNTKTRLKGLNVASDQFWVSWDKIGGLLFEGYTEKVEVSERDQLRKG